MTKSLFEGQVKFHMNEVSKKVNFEIGDNSSLAVSDRNFLSIVSDGEMSIQSIQQINSIMDLKCMRNRLAEVDAVDRDKNHGFTQRVLKSSSRIQCEAVSLKPDATNSEYITFDGGSIETNFYSDSQRNEGILFSQGTQVFGNRLNDAREEGYKYLIDIFNIDGEISLKVLDIEASNKVVAEVKTLNSTKNISFTYVHEGYGASLNCEELNNQSYR